MSAEEKSSLEQLVEFIDYETVWCHTKKLPAVIKVQLSGYSSGKLSRWVDLTENDILNWAEHVKRQSPYFWHVRQFIGEELWPEVMRRVEDGQTYGQAFMNAGDHADRPYSWQLNWDDIQGLTTWHELSGAVQNVYGTKENPKAHETLNGEN